MNRTDNKLNQGGMSAIDLHTELSKRFPGTYITVVTGAHTLSNSEVGEDYYAIIYDAPINQGGKKLYQGIGMTLQELLNNLHPVIKGER